MRSDVAIAAALLFSLLGGCVHSRVEKPAVESIAADASELDFWQRLESGNYLSNHDALHGLFLIADGKDDHGSFAARLTAARARGWLAADEELAPDEAATVGMVSVATCELLALDGGVTMRLGTPLFGRSPRYCTRELVAQGLLPERTSGQALRGLEFLDLAGRIDDRRTGAH